jgi:hypothetical protein
MIKLLYAPKREAFSLVSANIGLMPKRRSGSEENSFVFCQTTA